MTSTGASRQRRGKVLALVTLRVSLRSAWCADWREAWLGAAARPIVAERQDRPQEESV